MNAQKGMWFQFVSVGRKRGKLQSQSLPGDARQLGINRMNLTKVLENLLAREILVPSEFSF